MSLLFINLGQGSLIFFRTKHAINPHKFKRRCARKSQECAGALLGAENMATTITYYRTPIHPSLLRLHDWVLPSPLGLPSSVWRQR